MSTFTSNVSYKVNNICSAAMRCSTEARAEVKMQKTETNTFVCFCFFSASNIYIYIYSLKKMFYCVQCICKSALR